MSIENQLCEAIELITENAVKKAGYDRTVQATIMSCTDASTGQYKVKYQDNIFYAYSTNTDITYTKNTLVYILIPGSDLSNQKTIIGTVSKLGTNYLTEVSKDSKYSIIGANCISSGEGTLNSYHTETKTLYDYQSSSNVLSLNIDDINEYIAGAPFLVCGATFQTSLASAQQQKGNYGVIYQLDFQDNTRNQIITRSYVMDVSKMSGNPYKLLAPTRQVEYFNIDGENFVRVNNIKIFVKDFPIQDSTIDIDDIFITNFQLCGAEELSEEELLTYSLVLSTPNGAYFTKYAKEDSELLLRAQVMVKGQTVTNTDDIKYYWFVENATIKNDNKYYNENGGAGWKCLNDFNVIQEETEDSPQLTEWVSAKDSFYLKISEAAAQKNVIKCVAIYNDNILSKEVTIKNYTASHITIVSDSGLEFYYDSGNPTITCLIDGAEEPSYTYDWVRIDNTETIEDLDETSNKIVVQVNTITDYVTYKCGVSNGDLYLGTASITLSNTLASIGTYRLSILNGTQVFKYDENGVSPASITKDDRITIPKLELELYNAEAGLISNDVLKNFDIEWHIPNKNTLLSAGQSSSSADEIIITGETEIEYSIASVYNYFYVNNQITVNVIYQGQKLTATTDFLFLKEGENGTNGTDFVCRIVPNILDLTKAPSNVILTNDELNYTPIQANKWLRAQLYQDGELVFDGTESQDDYSLTWSILKNQYEKNVYDYTNIAVDAKTGVFSSSGYEETRHPADIVKATITYDGIVYSAVLPIVVINLKNLGYNIGVVDSTGFKSVLYTSDGKSPKYSNINPFEVFVEQNGTDISANSNITYNWRIRGEIYEDNKWVAQDNLKKTAFSSLGDYQQKVTPKDSYDGQCVTNAVECIISVNSAEIGRVNIPVHMSLNKYGLSAINSWDGNSIQINEEGGFILSPQVGAGAKNSDNTFTGLIMGEVKEGGSSQKDIGLIGYSSGERSLFLDAESGKAIFGKTGSGQIIVDPTDNTAIIQSGNYSESEKTGMLIDFTTPEIKFGSGNFTVNKDGEIDAKAGVIGNNKSNQIQIGGSDFNSFIYTGKKNSLTANEKGFYLGTNGIALGPQTNSQLGDPVSVFQVNADGSMYASNLNIQSSESEGSAIRLKIDDDDNAAIIFDYNQEAIGYIDGTGLFTNSDDTTFRGMVIQGSNAILLDTKKLYVHNANHSSSLYEGTTAGYSVLAEYSSSGFWIFKKTTQKKFDLNFVNGILCGYTESTVEGVDTSNAAIANRIDSLDAYEGPDELGFIYDPDGDKWYMQKTGDSEITKINIVDESTYSRYVYVAIQDKVARWTDLLGDLTQKSYQSEERTIALVGTDSEGKNQVTYKPVFRFEYVVQKDSDDKEYLTLSSVIVTLGSDKATYTYNASTSNLSWVKDSSSGNFFYGKSEGTTYTIWNNICENVSVPNMQANNAEVLAKLKEWSEVLSLKEYSTQIYSFIDKFDVVEEG